MLKIFKYFVLTVVVLLLLLLGTGYFFLNTTTGLKQTIQLLNRYSGYQVKAQIAEGRLLNKTTIKDLVVQGENLSFLADRVVLDWNFNALFKRSLVVNALRIDEAELWLKPTEKKSTSRQPFDLNDIDWPFSVWLEELQLNQVVIKNPVTEKADFMIDHFKLGIDYQGQKGTIHTLDFKAKDIDLQMTGEVITKGDFPLQLTNQIHYQSTVYGNQVVNALVQGALKESLNLTITGRGLSDFQLDGQVSQLFGQPEFSTKLSLQQIQAQALGLVDTALSAELSLKGQYQLDKGSVSISADGEVWYDSPQTDRLKLTLVADFDGNQLSLSPLTLDLLTAKQQLAGQATYRLAEQAVDFTLNSERLHWPQAEQQPVALVKQLAIQGQGTLENYQLTLSADAHTDVAGIIPLQLQTQGDSQQLNQFKLSAWVAEQPIQMTAKAAWAPTLAYDAKVNAPWIPAIKALPDLKQLVLNLQGDDKGFSTTGQLSVSSAKVPTTQLDLQAQGSYTELDQAQLLAKTLGGQISLVSSGKLSPLQLHTTVKTQAIQPQVFYPDIQAHIDSEIKLTTEQHNNQLIAEATLEQLSGKLQGYPLSGSGQVLYSQADNQLKVSQLAVNLAGNVLKADGLLALESHAGDSDLKATIDAPALKRLLPDLKGSLAAEIMAKGHWLKPQANIKLTGKQLAYQQYQLDKITLEAKTDLAQDYLELTTLAMGLQADKTRLDQAKATVNGKFSEHQIAVLLTSADEAVLPSLRLKGQGHFDSRAVLWSGQLKQLRLNHQEMGKWQLHQPVAIKAGAELVSFTALCLRQQTTQVCAKGQLAQQDGAFDAELKQLNTKQFAAFLPASIEIDTTLSGTAKILLADGKPTVTGQLSSSKGGLRLQTGQGYFDSQLKRFFTDFNLKNNKLNVGSEVLLSKLGAIKIQAALPNIQQSVLEAKVEIDNPSLAFIEEIVPQLSQVKGRISGAMTVVGDPAKQLQLSGKITLHETDFAVPQFGSQIRELNLDVFALDGRKIGFKGGAKAGKGQFAVSGEINPANQQGSITLKGKDFQLADSNKLKITLDPDLQLVFADTIQVRGRVVIPQALIVPESSGSKVTVSEDVVLPQKQTEKKAASSPLDIDIDIALGDDVRVASADIETRLQGALDIKARPGNLPTAGGIIAVETGEMRIYGQLLTIERGRVIFSHGPITNPALDIRTTRTVDSEDLVVGANVLGSAQKPQISLFSTPSMPDASILSFLLFGRPPNSDSFGSMALLQTGGLVGANTLARSMRSSVGLDVLDFTFTGMEAGKNLSKKLYVGMRSSFFDAINAFLLEYKVSSKLKLESAIDNSGQASGDLIYSIETD